MRETQCWGVLVFSLDHSATHSDEAHRDGIFWANSGHTLGYCSDYEGLPIFPPVPTDQESACRQIVQFAPPFVHLSSFSRALTYSTDKDLVVVYYD
jgi:hypothetical protein